MKTIGLCFIVGWIICLFESCLGQHLKMKDVCQKEEVLIAYPEGDIKKYEYFFGPIFDTDNKFISRLLEPDMDIEECHWEIRAKEGHYTVLSFPQCDLQDGDSFKIYDGASDDDDELLAQLKKVSPDKVFTSSKRSLFIVFKQGRKYGYRKIHLKYVAVEFSKAHIITIAVAASCVMAFVGLVILVLKFTHACRPCRKRCCQSKRDAESPVDPQELQCLSTPAYVHPNIFAVREDNLLNEERAARERMLPVDSNSLQPPVNVSTSGGINTHDVTRLPGIVEGSGTSNNIAQNASPPLSAPVEDHLQELESPTPDDPPPSYDSIFGHLDGSHGR